MAEKLGRYELLEKIGEGGFAVVYRAHDLALDRFVALKELRSLLLTDVTWVKRFRREARAIARLDHPRIVPIYDVGQADGRHFIVMRLIHGPSLDDFILKRGCLPWPEAVKIAIATAEGLDYAHAQGILHRDLKPGNILVDAERGPLLTDFGFAKLAGESTQSVTVSGDVVGTPHYIAPEAWEGAPATSQADIYALGCILYELITGEKLFQGETPPAIMLSHFKPLALPATWPEGIPAGVTEVFKVALARKPANRYRTAAEMVRALAALSADNTLTVRSTPIVREAVEPEDRAPAFAEDAAAVSDPSATDQTATEPMSPDPTPETAVAAQAEAAEMWRQKAEQALAAGNLEGARSAAYQWQELMPDAPDLAAFRRRLKEQRDPPEESSPSPVAPSPQPDMVKERGKRGCFWAGAGVGVLLIVFLLLGIGRFCATLNTTIANILPTVQVGETVKTPVRIPLPAAAETIDLDIEFGSGELTIRPGAEGFLVEGLAEYNVAQLKPEIAIEEGEVLLRHENPIGLAGFTTSNLKNKWDLQVSDTPMALTIDAGAARGDIELGALSLTDVTVKQGAANFELAFSEPNQIVMERLDFKAIGSVVTTLTGLANARAKEIIFQGGFGDFTLDFSGLLETDLEATVDGGAGSFVLIVPEGVAAEVMVDGEDVDVQVQGVWQTAGNLYTLPGDGPRIVIEANIDGGHLRLDNR